MKEITVKYIGNDKAYDKEKADVRQLVNKSLQDAPR